MLLQLAGIVHHSRCHLAELCWFHVEQTESPEKEDNHEWLFSYFEQQQEEQFSLVYIHFSALYKPSVQTLPPNWGKWHYPILNFSISCMQVGDHIHYYQNTDHSMVTLGHRICHKEQHNLIRWLYYRKKHHLHCTVGRTLISFHPQGIVPDQAWERSNSRQKTNYYSCRACCLPLPSLQEQYLVMENA